MSITQKGSFYGINRVDSDRQFMKLNESIVSVKQNPISLCIMQRFSVNCISLSDLFAIIVDLLGNQYLSWLRHRKSTLEFHIPESENSSKDLKFWPPPTCTNFTAARPKWPISILFLPEKHSLMVSSGKNDLRLKMFCGVEKGFLSNSTQRDFAFDYFV